MRKSLLLTLEFPPQMGGTQSYYFNICKNLPSEKIVVLATNEGVISSTRRSPLTGDCGGALDPSAGGEDAENPLCPPLRKGESLKPSPKPLPNQVEDRLYQGGGSVAPLIRGVGGVDGAVDFKIYRKNLLVKYLYPRWLPMVWHLRRIAKKEKIELILVGQVLPCGTAAFLVNKFFKIPYVVYTHGLDILGPQKKFRKKKMMMKILRNAEKVISNSEFTKNEVVKLGIEREKIFVVYPSVENPLCEGGEQKSPQPPFAKVGNRNPPSPPLRRRGNFEELRKKYNLVNKKILLSVCRLVNRKGVDLVISALAKFSEELNDVVYVIVGVGPKMEDLKRVATSDCWQLPDNCPQIIFMGRVSDEELDLWYRMGDIFILTPQKSDFDVEGFGIVYIEAGSYSKPVIGSTLAGICESVEDGVTGILVDPDNVEQIGGAIVKLFNDEELRERLGRQGRERAEREFGVERQMERLREAIE